MVAITKAEKEEISKLYPNVHIVRTMKQKSKRHHYYCEESRGVMKYLKEKREGEMVYRGKDVSNARKKRK